MNAFPQSLTGIAAPIQNSNGLANNVDTDTIIPSKEMRSTGRTGLADGLFAPWRYIDVDTRVENPDFALNKAEYRNANILTVGANFGCGSSREHAVWALAEYGVRAIIAESFAPIFRGNCIRNFILPVTLPREVVERLSGERLIIELSRQQLCTDELTCLFDIEPEAKRMLVEGIDAIDLTLSQTATINQWTKADRNARPWVYLEKTV